MKRKVLDHEIASFLLGELDEEEVGKLKERLRYEDGNLERLERFKDEDAAFLERFPSKVFAAQVESRIRKQSYEIRQSKYNDRKGEGRMVIGKRVVVGMAALAFVGFSVNYFYSKSEEDKPAVSMHADYGGARVVSVQNEFETDFEKIADYIQTDKPKEVALDALADFLKKYEVSKDPDRMLWAADRYATLLERDGRTESASEVRRKIGKDYRALPSAIQNELYLSKNGIAKSIFLTLEESYEKMIGISVSSPDTSVMAKNQEDKKSLMYFITAYMSDVIKLESEKWTVAAYYRKATVEIDDGNSIRSTILPLDLSPSEVVARKAFIETNATYRDVEAIRLLKKALAFGGDPKSEYLNESAVLLEQLTAKTCPREVEMEALHSAIWEIEHGTKLKAQTFVRNLGKRIEVHFPDVIEFRKKVLDDTPQTEIILDAENLRMETETGWVCQTTEMHDRFHQRHGENDLSEKERQQRLDEQPYLPKGMTHEDIMQRKQDRMRQCNEDSTDC